MTEEHHSPSGRAHDDALTRVVVRPLAGLAAALAAVMLLLGNGNLFWRWITGQQIPGATELLLVLLPIAVFAAAPMSELDGTSVRSTFVIDRLRGRTRRVALGIGLLLSGAVAAITFAATASTARASAASGEVVIGVRNVAVWPTRIAIAVGLLGMVLVFLRALWHAVRGEEPDADVDVATTTL